MFEEYYYKKNSNIQEAQSQMINNQSKSTNMYPQSQEPMPEEHTYMMFKQQQKRKELEQIEKEKKLARQIIESQQREKPIQEQIPNKK